MQKWNRGCVESFLGRVGVGRDPSAYRSKGISGANQGLLALHRREKEMGRKKIEVVPKAS